jgi:cyclopropane-fatty-acyl-phospholipid synthase
MAFVSQSFDTGTRNPHRGLLCRLADRAVPALSVGRLRLVLPNGETLERRGEATGPDATMVVRRWRALRSMLLNGETGFTESYLDGEWTTPDLAQLLELLARNETVFAARAASSRFSRFRSRLAHRLQSNSRRGSRRNIAAHYDLGNEFFEPWLDVGMSYSSALWTNSNTLERAQQVKLDRIASLLDLTGGERILEIGCGWGALAEKLIRGHGANVLGITLSMEQLFYAQSRLAIEAMQGRANLRLMDYRDVPGKFDRIASIEMMEAVGERYWPDYFGKLRECLVKGGVAVLQAITIDEQRFASYRRTPDFIQRCIFPGGVLPTSSIIEQEASRAGLKLVHHESFGDSYAKTLREWRARFLQASARIQMLGFGERFCRMWEYYLAYCEAGFRLGTVDVGFFKFAG